MVLLDDMGVVNPNIHAGGFLDEIGTLRFGATGVGNGGHFTPGSIFDHMNNLELSLPNPLANAGPEIGVIYSSSVVSQLTTEQETELLAGQWTLHLGNGENPSAFTGPIVLVPEPSVMAIAGVCVAGALRAHRRRRQRQRRG